MKLNKEEKWLRKKLNKMTLKEFQDYIYKVFMRCVYYDKGMYYVYNYFGKCYLECETRFLVWYWLYHVEL